METEGNHKLAPGILRNICHFFCKYHEMLYGRVVVEASNVLHSKIKILHSGSGSHFWRGLVDGLVIYWGWGWNLQNTKLYIRLFDEMCAKSGNSNYLIVMREI